MEQCLSDLFQGDLGVLVDKYREQGMTYAEAVGVLEIVKLDLYSELSSEG